MTASVITVVAVVAGIVWLAVAGVSAIRNRGSEEISPNLAPGLTNAELETRRLESGQKAAIAFSALLAISLPLYFLGEQDRQEAFVEEFAEDSIERGEHLVEEFGCYDCHGPDGVGGVASFVEKRSGVTVSWEAPSLNDIFYRYDEDEVNFWVTFGRGNTPMPAWGLPGGGPMNEAQVEDVVNFLATTQVPQAEVLEELDPAISVQLDRLENAEATVAAAIVNQRQTIRDIETAPEELALFAPLAERAEELAATMDSGIDTDADGVADSVETELSAITEQAVEIFAVVDAVSLDPAVADADLAEAALAQLEDAIDRDPSLETNLSAVETAIEGGTVDAGSGLSADGVARLNEILDQATELGVEGAPEEIETAADAEVLVTAIETAADDEGAAAELTTLLGEAQTALAEESDEDGDGLTAGAEAFISSQLTEAAQKTIPSQLTVVNLDPANPESVGGVADARTVTSVVGNLDSLLVGLSVTSENQEKLLATERGGLEFLLAAQEQQAWDVDFEVVADEMEVSVEDAMRAVGIFNATCARCHTAGFSAGVAFTQEIGSGGFGPALWDGRPVVQFGPANTEFPEDDLLIQFLTRGSEAETPYGLNGFGSGRMPGFGAVLSFDDIQLLANYLRTGNLDGTGETEE